MTVTAPIAPLDDGRKFSVSVHNRVAKPSAWRAAMLDDSSVQFCIIYGRTIFGKVFDAYCERKQVLPEQVGFFFMGKRLDRNKTAKDLDMLEGDIIDVFAEQVEGWKAFKERVEEEFRASALQAPTPQLAPSPE
mmetsp:Transcript_36628/g.91269  ORF Transcript_36628/g.91269 Transcript_36628/m.91269 type:complete len:134 (-) Transcript_36628:954-1355(-)